MATNPSFANASFYVYDDDQDPHGFSVFAQDEYYVHMADLEALIQFLKSRGVLLFSSEAA